LRISVLAWGSIVWERQQLRILADFEPNGPCLPIEFCRISRDGRLTLVVDEACGALCVTYSATSAFDDLDAAIENLGNREGMPNFKGVGFTIPQSGRQSASAFDRHPQVTKTIAEWTKANGFDATIWTALGKNFAEKTSETFSVEAAIRYLQRDDKILAIALNYIRQAPTEVHTPVREAINIRWPT